MKQTEPFDFNRTQSLRLEVYNPNDFDPEELKEVLRNLANHFIWEMDSRIDMTEFVEWEGLDKKWLELKVEAVFDRDYFEEN